MSKLLARLRDSSYLKLGPTELEIAAPRLVLTTHRRPRPEAYFSLQHGVSMLVPSKDQPSGGQPHRARLIDSSDFTRFTHILAADGSNLRGLERIKPEGCTADVRLWGSYLDNKPIADPYYDSDKVRIFSTPEILMFIVAVLYIFQDDPEFEVCYQQCVKLSNAFLDHLTSHKMS